MRPDVATSERSLRQPKPPIVDKMAGILAAFVIACRINPPRIRLITSIVIPALFEAAGRRTLWVSQQWAVLPHDPLAKGLTPLWNPEGGRGGGIGDATEDGDNDVQADV